MDIIRVFIFNSRASPMVQMVKKLAMEDTWVHPSVGKIPWRKVWQLTPVFLPGESPWTEEPGGLLSIVSHRVGYN